LNGLKFHIGIKLTKEDWLLNSSIRNTMQTKIWLPLIKVFWAHGLIDFMASPPSKARHYIKYFVMGTIWVTMWHPTWFYARFD
jgi:hypothetical protein